MCMSIGASQIDPVTGTTKVEFIDGRKSNRGDPIYLLPRKLVDTQRHFVLSCGGRGEKWGLNDDDVVHLSPMDSSSRIVFSRERPYKHRRAIHRSTTYFSIQFFNEVSREPPKHNFVRKSVTTDH